MKPTHTLTTETDPRAKRDPADPFTAALLALLPKEPLSDSRTPKLVRGTRSESASHLAVNLRPQYGFTPGDLSDRARHAGFIVRRVRNAKGELVSTWVGL